MQRKSFSDMECGIAQTLERVGDGWTLLILREAMFGTRRFEAFHAQLGIARNILTSRLKKLEDDELIERTADPEDGRKTIYTLTESGRDLWTVLVALSQWGNRWVYGPGNEPSFVAKRSTGKPIAELIPRDASGKPVRLAEATMKPGPSASKELRRNLAYVSARLERSAD